METKIWTLKRCTPYVTGISKERGGAGPSPVTAYGVYGNESSCKT
jgi:hypothetical protein